MSTTIVRATPADTWALKFIDDLARRNSHALGFLPMAAYEHALNAERVILLFENDTPAGYIIHGPTLETTKIYQTVIAEDLRRIEHGRALVDELRSSLDGTIADRISLHCAEDLEANRFWEAIGFQQNGKRVKSKRRQRWQLKWQFELPNLAIHKLAQKKAIDARGLGNLRRLLLKGKLNLADVIHSKEDTLNQVKDAQQWP